MSRNTSQPSPFDGINDQFLCSLHVKPFYYCVPFSLFQILIVLEEMSNLLAHDGGKIAIAADSGIERMEGFNFDLGCVGGEERIVRGVITHQRGMWETPSVAGYPCSLLEC
jgi:hypothetical protein